MPAKVVHAVLVAELGPRWRQKFISFDDNPAAAASIGQVHRAVWKDGRDVAVKLQYPGAGQALISDLNQVSRVARLAASWVPGLDLKPILEELKGRVAEELDYALEAKSQKAFAAAFLDDPEFAIPDVVHHKGNVIVSEWLDGTPLSMIIASGSPQERDAAASRCRLARSSVSLLRSRPAASCRSRAVVESCASAVLVSARWCASAG